MSKVARWSGAHAPTRLGSKTLVRITRVAVFLAIALMLATSGVLADDNPKPPGYGGTQQEWEDLGIDGQKFWHDINVATWELNLAAAEAAKTEAVMAHFVFLMEECGGVEPPTVSGFVSENGGPAEPNRDEYENEAEYIAAWLDWWDEVLEWIAGLSPELQAQWELVLRNAELRAAIKEAWELIHLAEAGLEAALEARDAHCTAHPVE